MVIRPATQRDLAGVLAVWQGAGAVPGATDDLDALQRLVEFDGEALLLAERDGAVVGTIIAAWDGWRGNMYRLAVVPQHRRDGVATKLVRAAEARLQTLGCRRITALVVGRHDPAVGLWTSVGYTYQVGTRRYLR